jgi:hypothetical protein
MGSEKPFWEKPLILIIIIIEEKLGASFGCI